MGKCFITRLNGVVDNSQLLKIGEFRIGISGGISSSDKLQHRISIRAIDKPIEMSIIGDGYFTDSTLSENKGKVVTIPANTVQTQEVYINTSSGCKVSISDKYHVKLLGSNINDFLSLELEDFKFFNNITVIELYRNNGIIGDIKNLSSLKKLQTLVLKDIPNISGNLSNFAALSSLETIRISSNKIQGDIASLKDLTSLGWLDITSINVFGNINALVNLKSLKTINLLSPNIMGDLSSFKSMNDVTNIIIGGEISGDLAVLPSKLKYINLGSSSLNMSWSSRSASATIISIDGVSVKLDNVDKMLQDQANCVATDDNHKIIKVIGTRTSASDAAVQTLQSKGYTVSITPA